MAAVCAVVLAAAVLVAGGSSATGTSTAGAIVFEQDRCPAWGVRVKLCGGPVPQLCAVDPAGGLPRKLVEPAPGFEWANPSIPTVTWSTDGSEVAYSMYPPGESSAKNLYLRRRGSATIHIGPGSMPRFSPDARRVAYVVPSANTSIAPQLAIVAADGTGRQQIAGGAYPQSLVSWSPSGSRIAFAAVGVWVVSDDGTSLRRLTVPRSGLDVDPDWSPDGGTILYTNNAASGNTIRTVSADGTGGRTIGAGDGAAWSPAGDRIAFARVSFSQIGREDARILAAAPDGSVEAVVSAVPSISARRPQWLNVAQTGALEFDGTCDRTTVRNGEHVLGSAGIDTFLVVNTGVTIGAGAGDDFIVQRSGTATLSGGAGNDLFSLAGADDIRGGPGDDHASAAQYGGPEHFAGNEGDDFFRGSEGNDVADGGSADDALYGRRGNDRLLGGTGDDTISGADGSDLLNGGPGLDTLLGGRGDDVLHARDRRRDVVDCGSGVHDRAFADRADVVRNCELVKRFP